MHLILMVFLISERLKNVAFFFMFVMSNSMVLCRKFFLFDHIRSQQGFHSCNALNSMVLFSNRRKQLCRLIPNAKNSRSGKRTWWQKFFLDEDWNWLGLTKDDLSDEPEGLSAETEGDELSEEERFEAWKRRVETISELQEAQEDVENAESRAWNDWLDGGLTTLDNSSWDQDWGVGLEGGKREIPTDPSKLIPEKEMAGGMRDLVLGNNEDEFIYEDRVFQYASSSSAKFLAFLVLIPWALDFVAHDYILMPFLDRYVKTVPLAAEMLDVRRDQKLEMIKTLNIEKARFRFELEIGKSPPLSDEEVWLELRHKAIELRDEWRLENRKTFANIWSDMVFGIALFILIYFNQSKVALLKFTGYKILNNISDTGKAFLIILVTDIFLGYHSESGWQTLIEIILEHYGLEVDQAAITIFICFVPVIIDACVKLWVHIKIAASLQHR
ncbi:chloroplast envelope membrane protein-like isoform X2 [Magnolia sinica]|uniref:chloroplast envelope membrane protein-like isoform X2 n=1 Tax=Magnolia sinica TaxID=86752 RepID=UPI0026584739|nr:chloroplast envelope membrane protein-like isoform X2 [Magnolia sinica]